jgi:hypothetical protein
MACKGSGRRAPTGAIVSEPGTRSTIIVCYACRSAFEQLTLRGIGKRPMESEQWFTLWMTILQVVAGGAATLAAVWIGASLALKGQRKANAEQRSRLAAERCLGVISKTYQSLLMLRVGTVTANVAKETSKIRVPSSSFGQNCLKRYKPYMTTCLDQELAKKPGIFRTA